ncbi:hypothetical protein V2G26_009878 [Clonostachys chloroleuca]
MGSARSSLPHVFIHDTQHGTFSPTLGPGDGFFSLFGSLITGTGATTTFCHMPCRRGEQLHHQEQLIADVYLFSPFLFPSRAREVKM